MNNTISYLHQMCCATSLQTHESLSFYCYSPDNWVHIHEGRYMQYIRMQNKQMIICENISGSAGDPH